MPMFRKKPVAIEARELTMSTFGNISLWLGEHGLEVKSWSNPPMRALSGMIIPTLEGDHKAAFGDMIIKGVKGEFYPCKPDIFAATYEAA